MLAASIGGGEWVVGPAIAVEYGSTILWVGGLAVVLQLVLNLEAIRYTLYTGEPALVGFMRLRPGSKFWGGLYAALTVAQLGAPALAAGCASVLFASFAGRLAVEMDASWLAYLTYGILLATVAILASGKTIERMLEYVAWVMVVLVFTFLIGVNILFVSPAHWIKTATGFVSFGAIPADIDFLLLATFAATAGAGGIGNLVISNWYRDKGFGMGAKVGAIAGAFAEQEMAASPVGKVFPVTQENLARWRGWWKYVTADQIYLWGGGCLLGLFLNVNLATSVIPEGSDLDTFAGGAFQARYMAEQLWSGFWFLALLNGFWILFSTHLNNTDILVRTVTDIAWVASPRLRAIQGINISRVYYSLLGAFTLWAVFAVNWGHVMTLFKVLGAVAGPIFTLSAIQMLIVNTRLLPEELRPGWIRRAWLAACAAFYGAMSLASTLALFN